jgi:hypothetical protein
MVRGADDPEVAARLKEQRTLGWIGHVMQDWHEHNHEGVVAHWQDLDDVSQQDVFEMLMHMLYSHHMAPQSEIIVMFGALETEEQGGEAEHDES